MKNNLIKIVILLLILLLAFNNGIVYADEDREEDKDSSKSSSLANPIENPLDWDPTNNFDVNEHITSVAGNILTVINVIGIIISVIALSVLGIKYMLGSVEEKAGYKKSMIPYIIGVFFLATATTVPNIISRIVSSLGK